ncbi:IncFII RepA protein family [Shewanella psychrophila]|uniref:IncFII RepA protein family n=1 Tax=Shewanella psychrophila TaxID=225848 RepID=A0A1S6HW06_9GAMM|nr:plasmid replication initiator RepA [Shewanella psychrophila]AQS39757.1 IncFII RepA protein family [Shewanella psychrophila]
MQTSSKRQRGHHSTRCLNPKPVYERAAHWNPLPGELGKTFKFCCKRDVSCDPHFVHLKETVGRQRHFKQIRRHLLNAFFQMCISRHSLVEGIIDLNLDAMAIELSKTKMRDPDTCDWIVVEEVMTVSRISRLINEVIIPFGLAFVQSDGDEADPNHGMVWDKVHRQWFPKVLVLTDDFYRIAGADLERLNAQREQQLIFRNQGLSSEDEIITVREARKRMRQQIFRKSWELRKSNSVSQRKRNRLAGMTVDERKHEIAKELNKSLPASELKELSSAQFSERVWKELHSLGLGVAHPPSSLQ